MDIDVALKDRQLSIKGELTTQTIPLIWPQLIHLEFDQIDFSLLTRIDSAGIAAIISLFNFDLDPKIKLKNCPQEMQQLLTLYDLRSILSDR